MSLEKQFSGMSVFEDFFEVLVKCLGAISTHLCGIHCIHCQDLHLATCYFKHPIVIAKDGHFSLKQQVLKEALRILCIIENEAHR